MGALQLRTTALHLDDAGNIDHVGYTDKVTGTDFYQEQCDSVLITIIYMQEHMLRNRVYITPALHHLQFKLATRTTSLNCEVCSARLWTFLQKKI